MDWKGERSEGVAESTRATGMPLGKASSSPEVTSSSPGRTLSLCETKRSSNGLSGPPPTRTPCTRLSCVITAMRLPGSTSKSTVADEGPARSTRPATPSGVMTGVPGMAPVR